MQERPLLMSSWSYLGYFSSRRRWWSFDGSDRVLKTPCLLRAASSFQRDGRSAAREPLESRITGTDVRLMDGGEPSHHHRPHPRQQQ
jgi:hypothetical protein